MQQATSRGTLALSLTLKPRRLNFQRVKSYQGCDLSRRPSDLDLFAYHPLALSFVNMWKPPSHMSFANVDTLSNDPTEMRNYMKYYFNRKKRSDNKIWSHVPIPKPDASCKEIKDFLYEVVGLYKEKRQDPRAFYLTHPELQVPSRMKRKLSEYEASEEALDEESQELKVAKTHVSGRNTRVNISKEKRTMPVQEARVSVSCNRSSLTRHATSARSRQSTSLADLELEFTDTSEELVAIANLHYSRLGKTMVRLKGQMQFEREQLRQEILEELRAKQAAFPRRVNKTSGECRSGDSNRRNETNGRQKIFR